MSSEPDDYCLLGSLEISLFSISQGTQKEKRIVLWLFLERTRAHDRVDGPNPRIPLLADRLVTKAMVLLAHKLAQLSYQLLPVRELDRAQRLKLFGRCWLLGALAIVSKAKRIGRTVRFHRDDVIAYAAAL